MGQILSSSVTVTVVPQGYNMGLTGDLMVVTAVLSVTPKVAIYGVPSDLFLTLDSSLQPGTSVYCHFDYIEYMSITQGLAVDGYTALCPTPAQDSNGKATFQITRISVSLDKVIIMLFFIVFIHISLNMFCNMQFNDTLTFTIYIYVYIYIYIFIYIYI
jgi:hypothetical protein